MTDRSHIDREYIEEHNVIFPPQHETIGKFDCPHCGSEIRAPSGGHVWVCHEAYGGCGARFTPIRAYVEVTDDAQLR